MMEQHDPNGPKPSDSAQGKPALPDPGMSPKVPEEYRLPLHGKMAPPTSAPSPTERWANLMRRERARLRRRFIFALWGAQLLVIAVDLVGSALGGARAGAAIPLQAHVFVGVSAGILILGLLCLGVQGAMHVLGKRSPAAHPRGEALLRRLLRTAAGLGVALFVIGGTAWVMIPGQQWKRTADYIHGLGAAQPAPTATPAQNGPTPVSPR